MGKGANAWQKYKEEKLAASKGQGNTASATTDSNAKGGASAWEEYKKQTGYAGKNAHGYEQVDSAYISRFLSDVNSFYQTAASDWGKMNWENASATTSGKRKTLSDLDEKHDVIQQWLKDNQGNLSEEEYRSIADMLGSYKTDSRSVMKNYDDAAKIYAQFDSQEAFDQNLAYWKDYDEKSRYDLVAGQREIEELEAQLQKLKPETTTGSYVNGRPYAAGQQTAATGNAYNTGYGTVNNMPYAAGQKAQRIDPGAAKRRELEKQISQKKQYLNLAKRIQNGIELSAADQNADFDEYSGYVSTYDDSVRSKLLSQYGMGYDDLTYEYINNRDGIRDKIEGMTTTYGYETSSSESPMKKKGYDLLTENEIAIYNYYYAKDGKKKAEEYLDSIQEELNTRKATGMFDIVEGNTALEMVFGAAVGLDQFKTGMKSAVNVNDDYIPQSAYQIASGMVREDLADDGFNFWYDFKDKKWKGSVFGNSVGQVAYDTVTTTANMAPSTLTSMAVGFFNPAAGAAVGGALMGASSAGNAYQEALNAGYSKEQARKYSTLVGASEAGLQYLLGGISSLGGKISGDAVGKMLNGIDNAWAAAAVNLGGGMLSEGTEEGLQEVLTPLFKNWVLMADEDINWSEVAYSGLLGSLTAAFMEGPNAISTAATNYQTGKRVQESGISATRLAEVGKTLSADSAAYQIAGRVDENTGAYAIGRLFNEVQATMTEQNINEITEALVGKGFDRATAKKNAEVLAYVVEGGTLTEDQIAVMEANVALAEAAQEVLIDENTTWNQRAKGYKDVLREMAMDVARGKKSNATETAQTTVAEETQKSEAETEEQAENKSIIKTTGKEARIQEIASIKNGKMTLRLDDGSTVDASDVSYATADEALVYETIAQMDTSANIANILVKSFHAAQSNGVTASAYALGIDEAFRYGKIGIPMKELARSEFASKLSAAQQEFVYRQGVKNAGKKIAKEQAAKKSTKVNATKPGKVHFDRKGRTFDNVREVSLKTMEQLAKALGIEFYVYESYVKDGERVYKNTEGNVVSAPNGFYDPADGSIHIDLNAGNDGKGTMLFTVAHELTHFIKEWSPAKFKILANFLVEQYAQKDVPVNKLVDAQIAKAKRTGRTLTREQAYEEVIADSMEAMLTDGNVVQMMAELKQRDKSLWQKICDWFKDLASDLKAIVESYKGVKPDSSEGKMVAQMQDVIVILESLYADALVDASENFQSAEKNTTDDGGVEKYSQRYLAADTNSEILSMVNKVANGEFKANEKVYFGTVSDVVADQIYGLTGIRVNGFKVAIEARQIDHILKDHGAHGATDHSMADPNDIAKMEYVLTNPDDIRNAGKTQAYLYMRDGKNRHSDTVLYEKNIGSKSYYVVQAVPDTKAKTLYIVTAFIGKSGYKKEASQLINANSLDATVKTEAANASNENVAQPKPKVKKYSDRDSDGNQLSKKQQAYFAHSKVRDEQGRLLVMYHGTPNGGYTKFRSGTYFTQNAEYADVYQNPWASSISVKNRADAPMTYKVYLNITKPFDTRNPKERRIYEQEFYRKYGTGTPLADSGLPDWVDGMDLQEFIEEMGYDYDGLILDEGGTGGYGEEVKSRGVSYVTFNPEQAKNVDNKAPTDNPDIRYSGRENVTYAEIQEEQQKLYQRERDLMERKRSAEENADLLQAMDDFSSLFSELKDLLSKRRAGTATQVELNRIEEVKALREKTLKRIADIQESLGLNAMSKEADEIRKTKEALRIASDEAWAREGAEKENKAIEKAGIPASEYFRNKALKAFKTTTNFNEAGYLLPDGKMLNFSGGERNHRYRDHREIGEIYEATNGVAALNRFLSDGNIRIMAESPGIDIASGVEPTKEQYAAIKRFVTSHGAKERKFFVDFSGADGHRAGNYAYDGNVNAERVVNDIKYYFEHGKIREQSSVARFIYSDRDSEGNKLSEEQQEYFKDSQVRDENGNLVPVYHTSQTAGYFTFAGKKGKGNYKYGAYKGKTITFLTDSYEMSASYAENPVMVDTKSKGKVKDAAEELKRKVTRKAYSGTYKGYANITNPFVIDAKNSYWNRIKFLRTDLYDAVMSASNEEKAAAKKLLQEAKSDTDRLWDISFVEKLKDIYGKNLRGEKLYAEEQLVANVMSRIKNDKRVERSSPMIMFYAIMWEFDETKLEKYLTFDVTTNDVVRMALDEGGYDGVIIKNVIDYGGPSDTVGPHDVYVTFYPEQFKAVDNRTPTKAKDMRYSERDQKAAEANRVLEQENEQLREDVAYLKEMLKLQRQVTGGTKFTRSSVEAAASMLMKNADAKGNKAELTKLLNDLYEYIAKGDELTWEGVSEAAQPAVEWLASHVKTKQLRSSYAQEVLKEIRGRRISLDEHQKKEVTYQYGSYNEFRKKAMGSVTFTDRDAISLDSQWHEWSEMYPNIFDPEISSNDMPAALMDAFRTLRSMTEMDAFSYDEELFKQDLLRQVYDSYWRVSTLKTVADVKQKEINRLKGKHRERMETLREYHRDKTEQLKAEHRNELKQVRAEYRAKAEQKQKALTDKWQESRAKSVENRNKTAMRHKIQNVVKELNSLLLNDDKKRHVPDSLKKAVADALDLVNMDTVDAEARAAKYADLIAKEQAKANPDQAKIDAYTVSMENILRKGEKMGERIRELHQAYEEIQNSNDPDIANAYDHVIAGAIKELGETIGNTSLKNMSMEQLSDVYDVYKMVLHRVREANKAMEENIKETITQLAKDTVSEVKRVGGEKKYRVAFMDPVKQFWWNNFKPVYAMEAIGSSTLTKLFDNVRSGEDVWAKDVSEAKSYYRDKAKKYGYDKWNFDKKYKFTSNSDIDFELTLEQVMSLYAYSRREQALDHLRLGGFVFDSNTETKKEKKLVKYKINTADAHQVTPEILADIVGTLTDNQKRFVEDMQEYLSTVMGAKGNEVTSKMYGVKLFKEKFYFPLKSAKQFMFEQNEVAGEVKIKNSGFTNKVAPKANNPVVLSNFMDVWSGHVNDMSMYHAFTLPLEDFNRVFNFNSPKKEGVAPVSVKGTIQNAYGPAAGQYVKQLITDLNGGARSDPRTGFISKAMGMFKKGAVFASLSVVVQQPSAMARAAALIDTKYFIGPKIDQKRHKALWEEVKEYAPVAIIKEMGYFDTNMGMSTKDYITGKEYDGFGQKMKALVTDSNYRDEVLSLAPALADEVAWCSIWAAVKRETKAKHPNVETKSEAFLKLAGKRFTEVIVKTQVYDSVLSRSANMRSKDTGLKMATAFMAEPTTGINMIADALLKGKRGGKKYARTAIGSVIAAQLLNSILVSFVYAARDEDEDETYLEKYLGSLAGGTIDGINPATYIPFIKDIVSIVKGYEVERSDMAVVSDLWNAWKKLKSESISTYRKVEDFAGSIAQIFGLPVKNIMRDVRSMYNAVTNITGDLDTTTAGIKYAVDEAITRESVSNKEQLYEARLVGDEVHAARVAATYEDKDAADAAVRSAIKDRFMDDEIDEETAIEHMMRYGGYDEDKAHWEMEEWKYTKDTGSSDGYGKYEKFTEAVRSGNNLGAVIKEYTSNGVKLSTLASQITEEFKPEYMKANSTNRNAMKKYLTDAYVRCGVEREDALGKFEVWEWEANGYEDATAAAIREYNENCAALNVPKDVYLRIRQLANNTENDVDENGKSINYSAMKKIMAEIHKQKLTSDQKTAIAKSLGWSEKNIQKYKLW